MSSIIHPPLVNGPKKDIGMKLVDSNIARFRVAKEFSENTNRINSFDFSQDGSTLITASDDDNIITYDCERGIRSRSVASKKYGVDLIHYHHADKTALHTSTKENDYIRYLSLHDNKYIRYFIGHEQRVVTLSLSPADDTFLSGSLDQTIRLWDEKQAGSIGMLKTQGRPIANYDPEGLIFVVGIDNEIIKLYDIRHFDKGPFNTFKLSKPAQNPQPTWISLKFSPDGKQILLSTDLEILYTIDAFSGAPLHVLTMGMAHSKPLLHPCEATYSPDSQYILCGAQDGSVHVWSASKGTSVTKLRGEREAPIQCVQFNPRYMMLASACSKLSFWIPNGDDV